MSDPLKNIIVVNVQNKGGQLIHSHRSPPVSFKVLLPQYREPYPLFSTHRPAHQQQWEGKVVGPPHHQS
jgi:hypothetical protein